MDNLAAVLTYLMAQKGIKSAELARRVGIGQPVIYRLMMGTTENPQILTLKPIADFFEVSIEQLMGYSPLKHRKVLDTHLLHELNNKIVTIKTIASVFSDLLPLLIDGYSKAILGNLKHEDISADLLPLLPLNCSNLIKTINQIQNIFSLNT